MISFQKISLNFSNFTCQLICFGFGLFRFAVLVVTYDKLGLFFNLLLLWFSIFSIGEKKDYKLIKMTVQPQIIVVGNLLKMYEVYVSLDDFLYCIESVLKAIDMTFKTYLVLHSKYPLAYYLEYRIHTHIIKTSLDLNMPSVVSFCSFNFKKKII
jgi:hypothetical protein